MRWSIFLLLWIFYIGNAYYFSYNKLIRSDAVSFCANECGSSLVDINNANDMNEVKELWNDALIQSSDTLWIGSSYTTSGQYLQLYKDSDNIIVRTTSNAQQHSVFVCNECQWQTIHKYNIDPSVRRDFASAQNFCADQFGTSVAGIHKDTDQEQAELIIFVFVSTLPIRM